MKRLAQYFQRAGWPRAFHIYSYLPNRIMPLYFHSTLHRRGKSYAYLGGFGRFSSALVFNKRYASESKGARSRCVPFEGKGRTRKALVATDKNPGCLFIGAKAKRTSFSPITHRKRFFEITNPEWQYVAGRNNFLTNQPRFPTTGENQYS